MSFEFLAPILTPTALATVQRDPALLAILGGVLLGLNVLVALAWFISYRTGKDNGTYRPLKIPSLRRFRKARKMGMGGK